MVYWKTRLQTLNTLFNLPSYKGRKCTSKKKRKKYNLNETTLSRSKPKMYAEILWLRLIFYLKHRSLETQWSMLKVIIEIHGLVCVLLIMQQTITLIVGYLRPPILGTSNETNKTFENEIASTLENKEVFGRIYSFFF